MNRALTILTAALCILPGNLFSQTITRTAVYYGNINDSGRNFQSFQSEYTLSLNSTQGRLINYTSSAPPSWAVENFPYGKVNFSVTDLAWGASTIVTLTLPENANIHNYWKFGPTPDDPTPHWYSFIYNGQVGAEFDGNIIRLHYIDGALGDDDLMANGVVVDPGGPTVGTPNFNYTRLYGDVDFNGTVQSFDAANTLRYSIGINPFPDVDPLPWSNERTMVADVDGNGLVQAYDASLILQYVVELIDSLPVIPGTAKQQIASTTDLHYYQDGNDLVISGSSQTGLFATSFEFSFLPNTIELDSAVATDFSRNFIIAQNSTDGELYVGLINSDVTNGEGELIRIPFRVTGDSATVEIRETVNAQEAVTYNLTLAKDPSGNNDGPGIPTTNELFQNFPNPFNPTTTIKYDVKTASRVVLAIYNLRGEKVRTLVSDHKAAGSYRAIWDGRNGYNIPVSSGVYITQIRIGKSYRKINRMVLLR